MPRLNFGFTDDYIRRIHRKIPNYKKENCILADRNDDRRINWDLEFGDFIVIELRHDFGNDSQAKVLGFF